MKDPMNNYIRRNQLDAGFPLFESYSLKWPGFVEFDDVNGKVVAQDGSSFYRYHIQVFDLKNYSFLYSIPDEDVQEMKIRAGSELSQFTGGQGEDEADLKCRLLLLRQGACSLYE